MACIVLNLRSHAASIPTRFAIFSGLKVAKSLGNRANHPNVLNWIASPCSFVLTLELNALGLLGNFSGVKGGLGAAAITCGTIFRRISRLDKIWGDGITPKAIWHVVKAYVWAPNVLTSGIWLPTTCVAHALGCAI